MKICVTGGTGFTGAALVLRLLRDGHEVRVLDKVAGLIDDDLRQAGAEITYASVTDVDAVSRVVRGCEIVHHVAAVFREVGIPDAVYQDVNVEGTRVVTRAAVAAGVRKLIYCSTQGVHGHIANPPGNEESPIIPEDYYQQTKYAGELAVRELASGAELEFTILRPTAIYGPFPGAAPPHLHRGGGGRAAVAPAGFAAPVLRG